MVPNGHYIGGMETRQTPQEGDKKMTTKLEARKAIRAEAERRNCKYRITANGEVHFYGRMPNGNTTGWWLFGQTVAGALEQIHQ